MSVKKKMLFDKGDRIQWTVSSPGYLSQSGQLTINEDTTINVNLVRPKIVFSWDGGGEKTVRFGSNVLTSTSPIYLGNDGPMTDVGYKPFENDTTTKNVFIDAEGFSSDKKLVTIFDYGDNGNNKIENVEIINSSHLTNLDSAFMDMLYLRTVSVDTSGANILNYMFARSTIVKPPVLNTSNATSIKGMFYNCPELKYIEQYDFSKVTDMWGAFAYCPITTIPYLDTHSVTDIGYCFYKCANLKSVPLLDFSNVTSTDSTFDGCTSLTDVGGFIGLNTNLYIHKSPLTHTSALNIIDNLPVSSGHRVSFKRSTFATLTQAEIAKATDKGWTITYVL